MLELHNKGFRWRTALLALLASASVASQSTEPTLPQYAPEQHLGVATCANVVCHAVKYLEEESHVRQDEYLTWLAHDRHARAFTTLRSEESRRIANKMGIGDPTEAKVCLDCHADNVPPEQRGPRFHISDGVGCEACHGGAQKWISTHTVQPYDLQRNLAEGMYPTGNLVARAQLCASCHVGDERKLADHNIMGAGHPRTSFELDTFLSRQPRHYDIDTDYQQRKGSENALGRLLVGQAVMARQLASNLSGNLLTSNRGYPEVALFDCHACHRSMEGNQWARQTASGGLQPGSIRLNDGHLLVTMNLVGVFDQQSKATWLRAIQNLHRQSSRSNSAVRTAAQQLTQLSTQAIQQFSQNRNYSETDTQRIFTALIKMGLAGDLRDYIEAEQAVMALGAVHSVLPESAARQQLMDEAYAAVANDTNYQPARLRAVLSRYSGD